MDSLFAHGWPFAIAQDRQTPAASPQISCNLFRFLEPDFVVIYKGLTFVVEVDGDTYHNESPSDADKRLVPLTYEGVEVRRVPAKDLATDEAADHVVANLVEFMASRKASR